ncbi:phosphate-starvation-inducible PsiE family protein [Methanoplanus limicola]|uniref:Phosphate-starvation-inducible E-like protein n=1 Tax=Methanoplanus limicola DSM 2279 TaxID=937775 RepID=H1Z2X4_9EURY|nr:phosphate-starvation-inducible PsiE family protein [Methanoplanus limicola]EHQ34713.1 hypothetical protein Metlim_0580 [Methanoplanus limicola DSM 2279]
MEKKIIRIINNIETAVYLCLLVLLTIVIVFSLLELAYTLMAGLVSGDFMQLSPKEILAFFDFFLLVLIGIELMETIKSYLETRRIQVEIVLILAIIAVARKIIVVDTEITGALMLMSIGVIIFSLTAGYYLIKKGNSLKIENK